MVRLTIDGFPVEVEKVRPYFMRQKSSESRFLLFVI